MEEAAGPVCYIPSLQAERYEGEYTYDEEL